MSETPTPGAADEPPAWQPASPAGPTVPPPESPHAAPAEPAHGAPTVPANASRPPFSMRVIKLWQALVVAAACLIVGLGVGGVFGGFVGFVAGHHDRDGGRFHMDRRFDGGFGNRFRGPGSIDRWPQQGQQGQGGSQGSPAQPKAPTSPTTPQGGPTS